ncbi:putative dithiol-disulfide oxidoreductase (DUF899 family) [Actinoalloteichus hoggarensis]|uniref:Uncharacterized protein n=1 Tax=Actinoalloteichus hoggarensis TaxID=1470176 RepID=A0A221W2G0_9PSEU|nr:DUF899 family protein [Actinoalloteichus hoggarensis]ASO19907.1 hypothetical protein AHOG_11320 [Actinoalloteichus hoggarensis]MBB5919384.1 putative dithiol-disulfide oxidoreductase (DUF899 family) [Actinoalloteichus hoggarensis]
MEQPCDGAVDGSRQARDRLVAAERALWDAAAEFGSARRALPPGPAVESATPLTTASGKPMTLAGLFDSRRVLVGYHLRFDEGWIRPCPESARWADGLDALVPHLESDAAVAVFSPASPGALHAEAERRGWRRAALVSTQPGRLTEELGLRPEGGLRTAISLYRWSDDGTLRRNVFAADVPGGPWSLLELFPPVRRTGGEPEPGEPVRTDGPLAVVSPGGQAGSSADGVDEADAVWGEVLRDADWAITPPG